jgi:hypothetical protein
MTIDGSPGKISLLCNTRGNPVERSRQYEPRGKGQINIVIKRKAGEWGAEVNPAPRADVSGKRRY